MLPRKPSLTQISTLLQGALGRHGITKQVTAALVVHHAEAILQTMIAHTPLADDVRVVYYEKDSILLGCKNAAATFAMEALVPDFLHRMAQECPTVTLRNVMVRVHIERGNFL